MTIDELILEGETLVRPSFLLRSQPTDSGVVAFWGGIRADMPNELPPQVTAFSGRRHIFSFSEQLSAHLGIAQRPVSLFEMESMDGDFSYRVQADSRLRFADLSFTGEPLYATPSESFPSFPAVCLYGSDRVGAWLQEQGVARHDYWRVSGDLPGQYESEWQRRSPFYQKDIDVIFGGWHFLWTEDDFFMPPELRFVALTLRDAEPWFEIWHSPCHTGWRAMPRTT
jgi:hypothetical protein